MANPPIRTLHRRVPQQRRSRERFELLLDTADQLLSRDGYEAFTTTNVAQAAGIPASAVYRWFTDKDDLARALLHRHNERLDAAVAAALEADAPPTLDSIVSTIFAIYIEHYREHPSHVTLWFDRRAGQTTLREFHDHTEQLASDLRDYAVERGLLPPAATALDVQLNSELADRVMEFAFRDDERGDTEILERGLEIVQLAARQIAVTAAQR